jgi:hypothetical protein
MNVAWQEVMTHFEGISENNEEFPSGLPNLGWHSNHVLMT